MSQMNGGEKTPTEKVAQYIELRNLKRAAEAKYKEFCRVHYDEPMQELEGELLNYLNSIGADSISSKMGTVYKILHTSVTTADGSDFRQYVIDQEAWDVADWRPNKTMINELVAKGEPIPPGVNRSAFWKVGVMKGKS